MKLQNNTLTLEMILEVSQNINIDLPYDPTVPLVSMQDKFKHMFT